MAPSYPLTLLAVGLATVAGCDWQWGRFRPTSGDDAGLDGSADGDADRPSCAEAGGLPCGAGTTCLQATFAGADGADCCPEARCLDPATRAYAEAPRAPAPIAVDGAAEDWSGAAWLEARRPALAGRPGGSSLADLSASVAFFWDEGALYLFVVVTDDVVMAPDPCIGVVGLDEETCGSSPPFQPWRDDCVEIFLDLDPLDTVAGRVGDDEVHLFLTQLGEVAANDRTLDGWTATAAAVVRSPGWAVEASVRWPTPLPVAGEVIGFEILVDDNDENEQPVGEPNTREDVLAWSNDRFETGLTPAEDLRLVGLVRLAEALSGGVPSCPTDATFPCAGACVPCGYPGCTDPRCE